MEGAVYMRYRNLKIGSGPGNDVQLNQIGRCANVSDNHAVIFYDDVRKMSNSCLWAVYGHFEGTYLYYNTFLLPNR